MEKTNNISEKEIKKYFRQIKNSLVCDLKTKNKIMKDLRNDVEEYLEQNSDSSFENVLDYFGKPETIAEEFAISSGIDYVKKSRIHKTLKLTLSILLILASIFTIATAIVIIGNHKRTAGYYYEETIEDYGITVPYFEEE